MNTQAFETLDLLVLQPTPFCNLACKYCYLADKDDTILMSEEVVRASINRVIESGLVNERLTICWHAGEPMVPGVKFYRNMLNLIKEMTEGHFKVNHCIVSAKESA